MKSKNKHPFIVIEGGDGAGKGTQTELLTKVLETRGIVVSKHDFPRYETLFGAICGRALKGEFGNAVTMHPIIASAPYTLDRAAARPQLLADLERGVVVSNRYTPSNMAYQGAKLEGDAVMEFVRYMEDSEYGELDLPRPDLVIYLSVHVDIAQRLIALKETRGYLGEKGASDQLEADVPYQHKVAQVYRDIARTHPEWKVIECTKDGVMLSREDIHAQVLSLVETVL
jgi:dTMP kinase